MDTGGGTVSDTSGRQSHKAVDDQVTLHNQEDATNRMPEERRRAIAFEYASLWSSTLSADWLVQMYR